MIKRTGTVLLALSLLILVGQGCASDAQDAQEDAQNAPAQTENTPTDVMEKSADGTEDATSESASDTNDAVSVADGTISLSASPAGENSVQFAWTVADNLADQASAYRIARGLEPNPTFPSSYWWERGASHREHTFTGLPIGPAHFRVCAVIDNTCQVYSNDVLVTVSGDDANVNKSIRSQDEGPARSDDDSNTADGPEEREQNENVTDAAVGDGVADGTGGPIVCLQFNPRRVVNIFYELLSLGDSAVAYTMLSENMKMHPDFNMMWENALAWEFTDTAIIVDLHSPSPRDHKVYTVEATRYDASTATWYEDSFVVVKEDGMWWIDIIM
jgi:hypothetical protein